MMSLKLVAFVLIGLACLANLSEGVKKYNFPSETLEEAYRVFKATDGKPVGPQKTLAYLKILLLFYQDRHDTADSAIFLDLLKAGAVGDVAMCTQSGLNKIDNLLKDWHNHINVVGYLQHYREKLMELCVPNKNEILDKYEKLFTRGFTGGYKIFTKLNELKHAMYKDKNNLLGLDRDRIIKLVNLAEFSKDIDTDCEGNTLNEINSMITSLNKAEEINIKPYLEYLIKELGKYCTKTGR